MRQRWWKSKKSHYKFRIWPITILMMVLESSAATGGGSTADSTLTYATDDSITGIVNPRKIDSAGDWLTSTYLWGRLVRFGEIGAESGDLAKSWRRSPDGLEWTFELYPNVKWSDGSPITAAEVVASLKESITGTIHTNLSPYVKEIFAIGVDKIQFKLSKLPENFLFSLACPDASITDSGKTPPITGEYVNTRFSGPYKAIRAKKGQIEFERNPYYLGPHSDSAPEKVTILGAKDLDGNITNLLENKLQVISATDETILPTQDTLLRSSPEVTNHWSSPDWTVSLKFGKTGMERLSAEQRRWLLRVLWTELHDDKSFGVTSATGLRPPLKLGGVSVSTMEEWLQPLPSGSAVSFKKPLDIFVLEWFEKSRGLTRIQQALKDLHVPYRLIVLASQTDQKTWKRLKDSDYDLIFSFLGVADPDPDSAWRYRMEYYPGEKKPISTDELDTAMLERDRVKRAKMYQAFEKRILENPFLIPLRMASSRIAIRKPWLPPAEGQFEWGVQLWMFQRE